MPSVSYAFAVGNVRAKESALLKKQDIEQLLALNSRGEAASFLKDKGYGYAETPTEADALLAAEEQKLWEYVASVAPDFSVFSAFIVSNDYHNMKAVFKGMAVDREYDSLILRPSLIPVSVIEKSASEQEFSLLPEFCRQAAKEAYEALIKTGDSQLCDAILDASCMENKLKMSESVKIGMLCDLIKISVFYDNIKAAIRCARSGKSADFCDLCLVDTPVFTKKQLTFSALKGTENLLELLSSASVYRGAEAAEAYKASPGQFEKFVDNLLMSVAVKAKYVAVGPEPLIAYLQAKLAEIKAARIVVNGISTGEESSKTREMLRELYG